MCDETRGSASGPTFWGGKMVIQTVPGRGTRLSVELPLADLHLPG